MRELLSNSGKATINQPGNHVNKSIFPGLYSKESAEHVQQLLQKNEVPPNLFELYVEEIFSYLRGNIFKRFIDSDKFTRKFLKIGSEHNQRISKLTLKQQDLIHDLSIQI